MNQSHPDFELNTAQIQALESAVKLLKAGKLVAIPTETVYGLAANAFDEAAVRSIYDTKGRPSNNPLIVHIKHADELRAIGKNIPDMAWNLAARFWPGPLTMIVEKSDKISDLVSANYSTVAVRMPAHPLTLALLHSLDFPLVAPSANRSNHISPTKPEHVRDSLGTKTPFILDGGACQKGLESTIIGFENNGQDVVLYRQGALSEEELELFIGKPLIYRSEETKQSQSPGSSRKHYSPNTPLILVDDINQHLEKGHNRVGYLVLKNEWNFSPPNKVIALSPEKNLEEAASKLYDALHALDQSDLDLIVAQSMPNVGLGKSINDRLKRAAER